MNKQTINYLVLNWNDLFLYLSQLNIDLHCYLLDWQPPLAASFKKYTCEREITTQSLVQAVPTRAAWSRRPTRSPSRRWATCCASAYLTTRWHRCRYSSSTELVIICIITSQIADPDVHILNFQYREEVTPVRRTPVPRSLARAWGKCSPVRWDKFNQSKLTGEMF